jgi:ferredoxin like protein
VNRKTFPELLALDRYDIDEGHPRIAVDEEICRARCEMRSCLTVCPAEVYTEHVGRVLPDAAACLECGSCVVTCREDALSWHYPAAQQGISYRYG